MSLVTVRISHTVFGILTVLSAKLSAVLPIIFFLTFILYEFDEEWNEGDHAFEELREYGIGLAIGVTAWLKGSW